MASFHCIAVVKRATESPEFSESGTRSDRCTHSHPHAWPTLRSRRRGRADGCSSRALPVRAGCGPRWLPAGNGRGRGEAAGSSACLRVCLCCMSCRGAQGAESRLQRAAGGRRARGGGSGSNPSPSERRTGSVPTHPPPKRRWRSTIRHRRRWVARDGRGSSPEQRNDSIAGLGSSQLCRCTVSLRLPRHRLCTLSGGGRRGFLRL